MDVFLPQGFVAGVGRGKTHGAKRASQMSVQAGGTRYPVSRRWDTGFAVSASEVPHLKGVVALYDGAEKAADCLIMNCQNLEGELVFTIKRATPFNYACATEFENMAQASA